MQFLDCTFLDPASLDVLKSRLAGIETLEELLRCFPEAKTAQAVTQDEFTHDILLPMHELWLVFDTT